MLEITHKLEEHHYDVFLPQRDGIEFADLLPVFEKAMKFREVDTNMLLNKAIFTLDVFQVLDSQGLVLNMNGRVPDEGALVEAGIAWNAGKKIVIYKDDSRTLINGNDNPLILGLGNFVTVNRIYNIPDSFNELFNNDAGQENILINNEHLRILYEKGEKIFLLTKNVQDKNIICQGLIEILENAHCVNHSMNH